MPPIKGRMMGLQPATPVFRAAKSLPTSLEKKPRDFARGASFGTLESAEKLKRLRIPEKICRNLPSVKNLSDPNADIITTYIDDDDDDDVKVIPVPGSLRRCRSFQGKPLKCRLVMECEQRFPGIIWDVGFLATGNVFVCYGDGIVICNRQLEVQMTLDRIKLAGGAAVTTDGNIVAIDRFNDTVNIYSKDGKFMSSFPGGSSPMNLTVNKDNFIIVTDVGDKCVRVFSIEGTLLNTITQKGKGYELQWPLYVQVTSDGSLIVSDVLQRKVFVFDEHGSYLKTLQLKTYGANCVLRPHGICLNNENFFVVDNALDTVELFRPDDTYVQTLLPSEDGSSLKPKVLGSSNDGMLVIGGMTGIVRMFKFLSFDGRPQIKAEQSCAVEENMKHEPVDMDMSKSEVDSLVKTENEDPKTSYKTEYSTNDCIIIID